MIASAPDHAIPAGVPHPAPAAGDPPGDVAPAAVPLIPSAGRPVAALLLMSLVLTLLVFAWAAWDHHRRVWDDARDQVVDVTHVLEEHAGKIFSIHAASLRYVERLVDDAGWKEIAGDSRFYDRLREIWQASPELEGVWVVDPTGIVRVNTMQWPTPALDVSDREYFRAQLKPGAGIYIGQQLRGRLSGQPFLPISQRMQTLDGRFNGVAQLSLRPDYFISFYRSLFAGEPKTMLLIREDGALLLREPAASDDSLQQGSYPGFIQAPADAAGTFILTSPIDGVQRLCARRKVPNLPLYVVYGITTDSIASEWEGRALIYAAVAVPASLALMLVAWIAMRRSRDLVRADRILRQANTVLEARVADRTRHLDKALAEREMLLRDTHHRVKNNLQVVSSLLQLQASMNPTLRPVLGDALRRIQAMGILHEQLHRASDVDVVPLDRVITALAREIDNIHQGEGTAADEPRRVTLALAVEPLATDLTASVPVTLVLNEVLSNAFKHAYPGGRGGALSITLRREGAEGVLTVTDDGVGMPDATARAGRKSLGLLLIDAFTRQLRGSFRYEDGAPGTRFTLRFPLA
ncbi:sensor histidine kinase [Nitrospirillum sp. BR 11828]|uniref:sensor histidine kinase n=1 Tax=Nitrospirillum sp. BR 11828 TaxID=3104325 RepID=UPI002ACA09EB|nr:histidine kinase dimerization/phosphoacceptor domain -containing protein [Nitrospirillum sp. BR 11828]MDZ5646428.1 histidine kinase dimerization/phosphoacceptor domain -containing protein [Nitrospirillum sp. BR 11828]